MGPLPRPERQPDEPESHEKPTWPWEKTPSGKEIKEKPDSSKQDTKNKSDPKKEDTPEAKKDDQPKQKANAEEEKYERRSTLIEQSIALVTKYEEEPIPRDATTLARLMIAHQVVHLNSQLEQPEQASNLSTDEIEATLDYIAKLDAKFQDPTSKLEPEIEQSYKDIIKLAETTLEETPNLETVVEDFAQTKVQPTAQRSGYSPGPTQEKQPNDWSEQEFDRRKKAAHDTLPAVAAAALIYTVIHLGKRKKLMLPLVETQRGESDSSTADATSSLILPTPGQKTPRAEQYSIAPPRLERSAMQSTRSEYVAIPPRRVSPNLATAAIATSIVASHSTSKAPHSFSPVEALRPSPAFTSESIRAKPEPPIIERSSTSQRKIEHMALPQLLAMAETVSLGQGRYLRHEFEAGRVDKEGLVTILKSHAKGLDYNFEFRQQASNFANLKATSPEFLHRTALSNGEPNEQATATSKIVDPTPDVSEYSHVSQPLSLAPPTSHDILPAFASSVHKPRQTAKRLLLITIVALAGLIIVGWLAIAILNSLD